MKNKLQEDRRVFHDYGLVIYNSNTLEVIESIYPLAKSVDLESIKTSFQGFSISPFKGEDPRTARRKFVNGKIIPLEDPRLFIFADAPYYGIDPSENRYMIPALPVGMSCGIIIKTLVNGVQYKYLDSKKKQPTVRITATRGRLKTIFMPFFNGSYSTEFFAENVDKNSIVTVESRSNGMSATLKIAIV